MCAISKAKKRETCLHYDEVAQFFPLEFNVFFNKQEPKKTKSHILKDETLIELSRQNLMQSTNSNIKPLSIPNQVVPENPHAHIVSTVPPLNLSGLSNHQDISS